MACIKVWLQVVCIAAAYASPQCALFDYQDYDYKRLTFQCVYPYLDQGSVFMSTCAVIARFGYGQWVATGNRVEAVGPFEELTAVPEKPMRWLCPIDARPMPEIPLVYEARSRPEWEISVTLNPGSPSGHIDNVNSEQFPMVDDCAATYHRFNKDSRERECWKFRQMPHFSRQFQNLDRTVGIAGMDSLYGKLSPNQQVPECLILTNKK